MGLRVCGAWIVRTSITSEEQVGRLVDLAAASGLNTLLVQVRGRGDAYYRNGLEPLAEPLANAPASFDPLQSILDRARGLGIKVHAWLNVHYVWEGSTAPADPLHLVNLHPEWLMRSRAGAVVQAGGEVEGQYTCPSNLEVRDHLTAVYLDVVRRYAVAGIHFDYIRYPSREYCYCDGCSARFREYLRWWDPQGDAVSDSELQDTPLIELAEKRPAEWDQFRRSQISDLVRQISRAVKEEREECLVSAAVFANAHDAYENRLQDWKSWLARDTIDAVCPMAYTTDPAVFESQVREAVGATRAAKPVWAGIGAYRMEAGPCREMISRASEAGAEGILLFSLGAVTGEGADGSYLDSLELRLPTAPG